MGLDYAHNFFLIVAPKAHDQLKKLQEKCKIYTAKEIYSGSYEDPDYHDWEPAVFVRLNASRGDRYLVWLSDSSSTNNPPNSILLDFSDGEARRADYTAPEHGDPTAGSWTWKFVDK